MKSNERQEINTLLQEIDGLLSAPFRFMEVCGTHTVAIFRTGLRSLFSDKLKHVSGPGCPVCVTHPAEIALGMDLAEQKDVILTIFGDMMRVPDHRGMTLKELRAKGAKIEICYSPLDSLKIAIENPDKEVVFWGIGFETTVPTVGATIVQAQKMGIENFSVLSCHKLVPPALRFLVTSKDIEIHGFLLPGHVSTVIGVKPYEFLAKEFNIPAVISGFEAIDILQAIYLMIKMDIGGNVRILNQYTRAVKAEGNKRAQEIISEVFRPHDGLWRGIGTIEGSGLEISDKYSKFDAKKRFDLKFQDVKEPKGCRCGEVLQGKISPDKCPLFGKKCTPLSPVGPCMVSTEGSCAAFYKYGLGSND